MPRRPRCSATALSISVRVHRIERNAASSVASARGRRNCLATSTAVGEVARRPCTRCSRAAVALVNYQTDCRTHPYTGVEHVNGGGIFRVKPVQDGGRTRSTQRHGVP